MTTGRPRRALAAAAGRWLARSGLALLALGILATPFWVALSRYQAAARVSTQYSTPPVEVSAAQAASWRAAGSGLPQRAPPVVVSYHEIRPIPATAAGRPDPVREPRSSRVVTPAMVDAHLSALTAAGYRSITAAEYVAYLRGGPVPPRSVLLAFDKGTHWLWAYADRILARHGMRGVVFLVTANIGERPSTYLSWDEVTRMAESGRWEFASNTRSMNGRVATGPSGPLAPEATHRRWLPEEGRQETIAEHTEKVRADLTGSVHDIVSRGLPQPTLFAYPFAESFEHPSSDPEAAAATDRIVRSTFVAGFNNITPVPLPTSRKAADWGLVTRIEARADTTPDQLLADVRSFTSVTPADARPLDRDHLWSLQDGRPAPVAISGGTLRFTGTTDRQQIHFGQYATADWIDYEVSVDITGLDHPGVEGAAVLVRVGSGDPVAVRVGRRWAVATVGVRGSEQKLDSPPLAASDSHRLQIIVSRERTVVFIDGERRFDIRADSGPRGTGGIGMSARRSDPASPWPVFRGLGVAPTPSTGAPGTPRTGASS